MVFQLKHLLSRGPELIKAEQVAFVDRPRSELWITFVFILCAGTWSVFSDLVLDQLLDHPEHVAALETMKGINFVLTSSLLLYVVLRRSFWSRRQAEAVSRLNHKRFETVALATTDAIWDWNLQTNAMWFSDGFQKLVGGGPTRIVPSFDWLVDRLHPEEKERLIEKLRHHIDQNQRTTWSDRYRFRRNDGSYAIFWE